MQVAIIMITRGAQKRENDLAALKETRMSGTTTMQ
jgi:hypothetical protein